MRRREPGGSVPRAVWIDVYRTEPRRWQRKTRPQTWRWRAIGSNGQQLAQGEAYVNRQDCLDTVYLLFGHGTEVTQTVTDSEKQSATVTLRSA